VRKTSQTNKVVHQTLSLSLKLQINHPFKPFV